MELEAPINRGAVVRGEAFILAVKLADGWRAIESQSTMPKATKARRLLIDWNTRAGVIQEDSDVRILRAEDVTYKKRGH